MRFVSSTWLLCVGLPFADSNACSEADLVWVPSSQTSVAAQLYNLFSPPANVSVSIPPHCSSLVAHGGKLGDAGIAALSRAISARNAPIRELHLQVS
jgi:hypothetical protein